MVSMVYPPPPTTTHGQASSSLCTPSAKLNFNHKFCIPGVYLRDILLSGLQIFYYRLWTHLQCLVYFWHQTPSFVQLLYHLSGSPLAQSDQIPAPDQRMRHWWIQQLNFHARMRKLSPTVTAEKVWPTRTHQHKQYTPHCPREYRPVHLDCPDSSLPHLLPVLVHHLVHQHSWNWLCTARPVPDLALK